MPTFVQPQRTGAGLAQAAWIRARWAEARSAASGVGLSGDAAMRAAVQAVALWLLASGPAHEWNHNASGIPCAAMRAADECVNLASVDPDWNGTLGAFLNGSAHAAAFWAICQQSATAAGVNFPRWMGTLDAGAAYRFSQEWTEGAGPTWPQVVSAVRTVGNAVAVSGWTFPDQAPIAPVEFTRSGGGFGGPTVAGGGSTSSGGGSSGGRTGTSTGGTSGGGSTDVVGAANDYARAARGARSSSVALLALFAVGLAMDAKRKPKGKR